MNNQLYKIILISLLVIVLFSIYFQFTTFGTGEYWVFVIILVIVLVVSKLLKRHQLDK